MDLLNALKRRDSRMHKRILVTVFCLCILILAGHRILSNNRTVEKNVVHQNYIVVQTNYRFADKATFDLKNESYVALYLSEAVKDGNLYHGYKKVSNNGKKEFELSKRDLLRYSMLATSVTQKQIRDSNFRLKQSIPKKAQQRLKEVEPYFRNDTMIVEYNQKYL
ncbi:hypothetical protein CW563_09650, partial [Campylobacter jejuni]|nr:hypothetical protein [Campylobacter jejuni]